MYAIIEDSGQQIRVSQGDVIKVALREGAGENTAIKFDRVLYVGGVEGQDPKIGQPLLSGASVTGDVLSQEKTDKVVIMKFSRRKNVRRKRGHRQDYLSVKITGISA
jgi:large subunit ribosomal protein L21